MLYNKSERKNYYVHRLVAEEFIPKVEGKPYVNHLDGNKLNNNDWNLQYTDPSGNMLHSFHVLDNESGKLKKPVNVIKKGRIEYQALSVGDAARHIGGGNGVKSYIARICKGIKGYKTYRGYTFEYSQILPPVMNALQHSFSDSVMYQLHLSVVYNLTKDDPEKRKQMRKEIEPMLTNEGAVIYTGYMKATLRKNVREGYLSSTIKDGQYFYHMADLDDWMLSVKTRKEKQSKQVNIYLNGKFVCYQTSVNKAAKYLKSNKADVSSACLGKRGYNTIKGYTVKFSDKRNVQ